MLAVESLRTGASFQLFWVAIPAVALLILHNNILAGEGFDGSCEIMVKWIAFLLPDIHRSPNSKAKGGEVGIRKTVNGLQLSCFDVHLLAAKDVHPNQVFSPAANQNSSQRPLCNKRSAGIAAVDVLNKTNEMVLFEFHRRPYSVVISAADFGKMTRNGCGWPVRPGNCCRSARAIGPSMLRPLPRWSTLPIKQSRKGDLD